MKEESSSFFEKKEPKKLRFPRVWHRQCHTPKDQKFFWFFFFKKRTAFFYGVSP